MSSSQISLSVIVLGEARELLSVLRRNRRFSYLLSFAASSQPAEHPLVKEVKSLRDVVRVTSGTPMNRQPTSKFESALLIPPDALLCALDPFLEVIKSRDASGIITGHALLSLDRIAGRLISLAESTNLLSEYAVAFGAMVDAAAACRFDATDPASDEVVLARITRVIARIATSSALPLIADSALLRAVEACLGIAAGRRRASDLLKGTADAALVDIFDSVGKHLQTIGVNTASAHQSARAKSAPSSVILQGVNGSAFGYALDSDAFSQHGPASLDVVSALLELCSRMSDPTLAGSDAERSLGMQLASALLSSGGTGLSHYPELKKYLVRDCSRAILRSLGLFHSHPSHISASFTIAIQLVHVLEEDGVALLLALLGRVYPYYISGYEGVLPQTARDSETKPASDVAKGPGQVNGTSPGTSSGAVNANAVEIDPVIREIGLESLAALLASPGLLCVAYRVSDCDLTSADVVNPLLRALGYAARARRPRRRSKRLRVSSSRSNRTSSASIEDESDDDDLSLSGGGEGSESSRNARAAALLCAEGILAIVDTINDRLKLQADGSAETSGGDKVVLQASRDVCQQKERLQLAADAFNASEKMGKASRLLGMLKEQGLVNEPSNSSGTVSDDFHGDVSAIVRFLRKTPGLNKERIGAILGEPDKLSCSILAEYTATFQFEDRSFTESLRVFLESFRLPGESQKINRIVHSFANRYHNQNKPSPCDSPDSTTAPSHELREEQKVSDHPDNEANEANNSTSITTNSQGTEKQSNGVLKSADTAYVLSYSVVMLNTDQHNDSIRKKMTLDDFVRNCRGINEGEDLPRWFLADIFSSIAAVEIRMSDEAGIGALTDVLWDEQIKDMGDSVLPTTRDSRVFDVELFKLAWEPAVIAANAILNEAGDANSVQKALEGFLSVARCATAYRISRPTDAVVSSLATATTLRDGPLYGAIVRFGTDIKAQMASVALSGVSRQCADGLEADGWQSLVAYLLRLHALQLLPQSMEQHLGGYGTELVGVSVQNLPTSTLIPAWWPSQSSRSGESRPAEEKTRRPNRPNGFFASLIAASIGTEIDSEDEDYYESVNGFSVNGRATRRTSHSLPYYLRMRSAEEKEARELARKCIAGCRIEDVIINEAKVLQSSALCYLSKAIARSAFRAIDAGNSQGNGSKAKEEEKANSAEESLLEWRDIAPPSPKHDSSAIVGVSTKYRTVPTARSEPDFSTFGLSSTWTGQVRERDERKAREFVVAFCVDLLGELTLQNRDRLHLPWPSLHGLLVRIIAPATRPSAVLERAVVALLRVGVRLLHRAEVRDDVLRGLNLLVRLPGDAAEVLAAPIAAGVYNIVKSHGSAIQSTSGWHAILSILESSARYQQEARDLGLETLSCMLKDRSAAEAVSLQTFTPLLHAILAYSSSSSVETSIRAIELLHHLAQRVSKFSINPAKGGTREDHQSDSSMTKAESELWNECWGPLFLGFASSVRDARGKVRNSALEVLERVVASGGSANILSPQQWTQALSNVILPLMTQLFSTRGFLEATLEAEEEAQKKLLAERNASTGLSRGRSRNLSVSAEHQEQLRRSVVAACNRTRMKAVTLTSKTFLQHHMSIADGIGEDSFTELWIGVLEVFRVAIESGPSELKAGRGTGMERHDDLAEHVPENVKNLLLVMSDCGLLKSEQHVRWNATFAVVRKFMPDVEEIINATSNDLPQKEPVPKDLSGETEKEPDQDSPEPEFESRDANGAAISSIAASL